MQKELSWIVIEEFDRNKTDNGKDNAYKVHIPPRVATILSTFRIGQNISTKGVQIYQKNSNLDRKITSKTSIRLSINIAQKINLIKNNSKDEHVVEYEDFCKIPVISYWRKQLNGTGTKNIENPEKRSTRGQYTYKALTFHNWLKGKTFKIKRLIRINEDNFQLKMQNVTFTGIDHMLELVEDENSNKMTFVKIIKEYLLDPIHEKNGTASSDFHAAVIKSFFSVHDVNLTFKFR